MEKCTGDEREMWPEGDEDAIIAYNENDNRLPEHSLSDDVGGDELPDFGIDGIV